MTKEEALSKVKGYLTNLLPSEEYGEVEEIIKALEQEPCEENIIDDHYWKGFHNGIRTKKFRAGKQELCKDAVNRQSVKEKMIKYGFHAPDMTVTEFVEDVLPPVTPTRKKAWKMF